MDDFEKEFKKETLELIQENLIEFDQHLNSLDQNDAIEDVYNDLFRIVHNIKGNAQSADLMDISKVAHILESRMVHLRDNFSLYSKNFFTLLDHFSLEINKGAEALLKDMDVLIDLSQLHTKIESFSFQAAPNGEAQKSSQENHQSETLENETDVTKLNVLLVDDEEEIAEGLEELINFEFEANYTHRLNGEDALEECQKQKFDFIITDYRMPKMFGDTFVDNLRKGNSFNQNTPILFLTAYKPEFLPCLETWQDVIFLEKPCSSKNLIFSIKCALLKGKKAA